MRYVQIGTLVCLVAIAGLLGAIYLNQRAAPPEVGSEQLAPDVPTAEPEVKTAETVIEPMIEPAPKPQPARQTPAPKPRTRRPAPAAPAEPAPAPVGVQPVAEPPRVEPAVQETRPIQIAGHLAPAPPPQPRQVRLPAGTDVVVRLDFPLSTERNFSGDSFTASLDREIVVDDMVIAQKGARVEGKVIDVVRAGRVKGLAQLSLELTRIDTADGQTVALVSNRIHREGEKSTGSDMKKVGVGAGVGALIGAIAGGGKGAAIGAGVGAGAGGGAAAATRGKPVELPAEERLEFRLMEALEITERL